MSFLGFTGAGWFMMVMMLSLITLLGINLHNVIDTDETVDKTISSIGIGVFSVLFLMLVLRRFCARSMVPSIAIACRLLSKLPGYGLFDVAISP
jgi:hypothetical protein